MFEARFQNFDDRTEPAAASSRVAALRAELRRRGLDGLIVPHADRHQNEYLPPSEERLAWLTGFSGSAGVALVLADRAVLFVDGRYTLQAREQTDPAVFVIEHLVERPPDTWIEQNLAAGTKLGYDPWLHTIAGAEKLAKACEAGGPARAWSPSTRIRWTPSGPTGRRRRSARSCCTICALPERKHPRSLRASPPKSPRHAPMRSSSPIRTRWPGPSTSAAATWRTRRWRWPSRWCRRRDGPRSMWTAA